MSSSLPTSGRESRRGSKSGASSSDAYKSSERREKAKSMQHANSRPSYEVARRGSVQPAQEGTGRLIDRPRMLPRTYSAPMVQRRHRHSGAVTPTPLHRDHVPPDTDGQDLGVHVDGQDEDEVAGVVGAVRHFQPFSSPEISEPMPEINIAVMGAEGVGKSTLIQRALGLPYLPPSPAAERKIPIDGSIYLVRLLELPIDDVDIDDQDVVEWPDIIEDKMMPKIDGALTLYDVGDRASLETVPEMLSAIRNASIPSLLISSKCDIPAAERDVDPVAIEQTAKRRVGNLDTLQTAITSLESHKRALSMILKMILLGNSELEEFIALRTRPLSNVTAPVSANTASLPDHSRSNSERTAMLQRELKAARHDSSLATAAVSSDPMTLLQVLDDDEMHHSFLLEETASEISAGSARSSASGPDTGQAEGGAPPVTSFAENGATFEELIDRLLAQPVSKADGKFAAIFLVLYRKFAAPGEVLEAIVERFDALSRSGGAPMTKTVKQLRYLAILEQWLGSYPGDFAWPTTKRRMRTFVAKVANQRIFSVAAKEMGAHLESVQEDDDTGWACCDKDREASANYCVSPAAAQWLDDNSIGSAESTNGNAFSAQANRLAIMEPDTLRSTSSPPGPSSHLMANLEAAQKQAQLLQPVPRQPLTKIQWRLFMDQPDDLVARELTRMDWIFFSSTSSRDMIRAVSLKDTEKARCKNLVHVGRISDHFNQIAHWVTNFVLLRDKPKHRALVLEKFMRVARKLRELNNYNALGAIVAGVGSSSVYRLIATRELISPAMEKQWSALEVLMSPRRSYATYRMAWENSSRERIPYLPLHRRDLVIAEEGNKTFLGDERDRRINWAKFEVMGDIIVSMQRAQGMPYQGLGGSRGEAQIKELVLDVKLERNEDVLFQRSLQCEPKEPPPPTSGSRIKEFFKR